jgi:transcriptional regulator with XRE-family HTH domain
VRFVHRRVRALIDDRGLRYDKVAAKLGLTKDRFAHIIDGRRPVPKPETTFYERLAAILSVDARELREDEVDAEERGEDIDEAAA